MRETPSSRRKQSADQAWEHEAGHYEDKAPTHIRIAYEHPDRL